MNNSVGAWVALQSQFTSREELNKEIKEKITEIRLFSQSLDTKWSFLLSTYIYTAHEILKCSDDEKAFQDFNQFKIDFMNCVKEIARINND